MQQKNCLADSESASSKNADSETYRSLFDAIKKQQLDTIEDLIRNGIDVNIKAFMNATPLHYAVFVNARVAVLQCLVSFGADIDAKTDNGSTPLQRSRCPRPRRIRPDSACHCSVCQSPKKEKNGDSRVPCPLFTKLIPYKNETETSIQVFL